MLNEKRPHFFEGFKPATSSELLKVPSKFIKHMEGRTSGSVLLVGPSGSTWHVDLIQRNDGLFFHDGWAAFVRDHFIEHGDSLVFRYDGNLHFTVQVFDQSACEKEAAFWAVCSQDSSDFDKHMGKKRERENTVSCLDGIFEGVPKKMRGQAAVFSDETENCSSVSKNTVTLAIPLQSRVLSENSEATIQDGIGKDNALGSYVRGCMPMLSAPEADRIARSFTSSFPHFTKIMKRFNVSSSYTLNIPYQFSMGYLPKCKVKIVLRNLKGESWTVNSVPTTKVQTSHTLCGGWMAFVRDNNVDIGDVCIFELVNKYEMRVHILRVGKEGLDCSTGKEDLKGLTNGYGAASHKISERLPKKMRGNSRKAHLQQINKAEISDKKGSDGGSASKSSACSQSKACNAKLVIPNKTSLDGKQGSHTKGCVSMKSAPEEKRAAQSFISSFPHFVRIMKKFNISGSYTLKIPYLFSMAHLPNCRTEIVLRNLRGESWTVNSIPTTKVQTLHTFCGGWMAFVRVLLTIYSGAGFLHWDGESEGHGTALATWEPHSLNTMELIVTTRISSHFSGVELALKMGEKCKDCRKWEEDMYWTHFQSLHFFQFLSLDFDQQLAIPKKFANNLKEKLPETVTLKGPSGATWNVGLMSNEDTLFFKRGWKEFVEDHSLAEDDVLMFKYNGDSRFDVLMFDQQSLCEKEATYFVRTCGHKEADGGCQTKTNTVDSSVEITHDSSHHADGCNPLKKPRKDDTWTPVSSRRHSQAKGRIKREVRAKRNLGCKELSTCVVEEKVNPDAEQRSFSRNVIYALEFESNRRPVTKEEKEKALRMAHTASTKDSFIVVMRPSHVYKGFFMTIPSHWATRHLPPRHQDLTLRVKENTWKARFYYRNHVAGLAGGWKKFVFENNLEESDVCLFELAGGTTNTIVFDVSIFRVIQENLFSFSRVELALKMGEKCKDCRKWEEDMYWTHFQSLRFFQFLSLDFDQQLAIPKKFANNLKEKLPETVTLKGPNGATWNVGLMANEDTLLFKRGWKEFVEDHSLAKDDVLMFKYNGDSRFDVLMFDQRSLCEKEAAYFVRSCEHKEPDGGCQTKTNIVDSSVEITHDSLHDADGCNPLKKRRKDDTGTPVSSRRHSRAKGRIRRQSNPIKSVHAKRNLGCREFSTCAVEEKVNPDAKQRSFSRNVTYFLQLESNRRPVTEEEKDKALLMAQAASTKDSLIVVMRPSHVYKGFFMTIPAEWVMGHLPPRHQKLILRVKENTWQVSFYYRAQCAGLAGGWRKFVVENNLEESDVCLFELAGGTTNAIFFDVSIFRVIQEVIPPTRVSSSRRGKLSNNSGDKLN
ncbi:hypothetical protein F0562_035936 [Nyssa sinensis]|uniref:TF-B3 domain-containing protein n=1 Tax=Nyssa sinensis TaxID=561372 RepID=A0A5J5AHF7_9ASTE|nr:hypothetical protein F0562_035936 [Nyssa sinensis]